MPLKRDQFVSLCISAAGVLLSGVVAVCAVRSYGDQAADGRTKAQESHDRKLTAEITDRLSTKRDIQELQAAIEQVDARLKEHDAALARIESQVEAMHKLLSEPPLHPPATGDASPEGD